MLKEKCRHSGMMFLSFRTTTAREDPFVKPNVWRSFVDNCKE